MWYAVSMATKATTIRSAPKGTSKKATTIRAGDHVHSGASASPGKTRSLLEVLENAGLRPKSADSRGSKRRAGRTAGKRALAEANSLSH